MCWFCDRCTALNSIAAAVSEFCSFQIVFCNTHTSTLGVTFNILLKYLKDVTFTITIQVSHEKNYLACTLKTWTINIGSKPLACLLFGIFAKWHSFTLHVAKTEAIVTITQLLVSLRVISIFKPTRMWVKVNLLRVSGSRPNTTALTAPISGAVKTVRIQRA